MKPLETITAHPLAWPEGWKRTPNRAYGRFQTSLDRARQLVHREIDRMRGTNVIISTNVPLRRDGQMYAGGVARLQDPGVAVYFKYNGKDMVFACDKYIHIQDNVQAIAKTIEALRGIERWGASDMMERAFTGFKRLTDKASEPWIDTLELRYTSMVREIKRNDVNAAFARLAKLYHPDVPDTGNREHFERVVAARETAMKEVAA